MSLDGRIRDAAVAALLVMVAAIFVVGFLATGGVRTVQCDGTVPAWMVPDDYDGGGCVELKPEWQGQLPENSDHTPYCLGLCAREP